MKKFVKNQKGQTLIEVLIALAVGAIFITAILGLATRSNRNANLARNQEQASKLAQQGIELVRNIKSLNDSRAVIPRANSGAPCSNPGNFSTLFVCDIPETLLNCNNIVTTNADCDEPPITNFSTPIAARNIISPRFGLRYTLHITGFPPSPSACSTNQDPNPTDSWCMHGNGDFETAFTINIGGVNFKRALYIADTPALPIGTGVSECNNAQDYTKIKQMTVVVTWVDQFGTHEKIDVSCIGRKV